MTTAPTATTPTATTPTTTAPPAAPAPSRLRAVHRPRPAGPLAIVATLTRTSLVSFIREPISLAIGRWRPDARAASGLITPVVIMLQFVSGIFFPLADLPDWMVHTFSVLPVRWSAELMRESFLPSTFAVAEPTGSWETGKGLLIVGAWLVAGIVAAVVVTRRDTVDR